MDDDIETQQMLHLVQILFGIRMVSLITNGCYRWPRPKSSHSSFASMAALRVLHNSAVVELVEAKR